MPRSRGTSDGPQRQSPRVPLHLRTTACSEANSVHRPVVADRSPKVSPRGVLQERKRGTKVADLETKLSKAQEQLKKLRDQLASAEAAKIEAEQALAKAKKRVPSAAPATKGEVDEEKPTPPQDARENIASQHENKSEEESVTSPATMDVFEVVVPAEPVHSENEVDSKQEGENAVGREEETMTMIDQAKDNDEDDKATAADKEGKEEEHKSKTPEALPESTEVEDLKAKLLEKEKEVEILLEENMIFKSNAEEETKKIMGAAQAKEAELTAKLTSMDEELKESRAKAERLAEQLEAAERTKTTLEAEMKRLKVQTEQWRKAAEAAAAALADDDRSCVDAEGGRRVAERCVSMDKHIAAGNIGWGSPLVTGDLDDDGMAGGGRRKGAGIRVFGDLWKKKGQHK
ncbi:interactor of constitutive active ROPs 4-like isoform X2 [Canna indica]|uniref:Interactor of constitutive active ROPs 4-like isoform X2 n=1 Tax=Canna indica TaxID=4628 RepID=A0AAQ3K1T5_9LILI|nr:interactor of constitutive active ROPs 4-like isoform X2 [Canna indica]